MCLRHHPEKTIQAVLSVQVLRGFAAVAVILCHAWDTVPDGKLWIPGSVYDAGFVGVDVFFLISGFIMVYVSPPYQNDNKPASDFLIKRIIRIYPMYATITSIVVMLAVGDTYRHATTLPWSTWRIVASYLFVPTFNEHGTVTPVLWQGWTLFFEMLFYFCFFVVLSFSKRHLLAPLTAILVGIVATAKLSGSQGPIATFFGDPIVFEFVFGCAVGLAFQRNFFTPRHWPIWLVASSSLFACVTSMGDPGIYRFVANGVPATMLLIVFLKLDLSKVKWPNFLLLLGNASYSIYLTHFLTLYRVRNVIQKYSSLALQADLQVLLFTICALFVGILVYLFIERPLQELLSGWYARLRKAPIKAVS